MSYVMHVDVIASEERGITQNDWLDSKHTYSFGRYHNLSRLNFGTLRVFNDDIVQPGKGFAIHSHENMEIITIVLDGALEHKDNKGNHGILKPGDVQRMTAGTGIEHSEFNASQEEPVHFLQIWVYPKERDLKPSYEQK
ncbi:MAG: putative quercetin 2,3-dioxygenase, partial [Chlamydiae bacterium]|nr:putative quercetin 2,3-dioxygenase [Chlamydiota bacterium]